MIVVVAVDAVAANSDSDLDADPDADRDADPAAALDSMLKDFWNLVCVRECLSASPVPCTPGV